MTGRGRSVLRRRKQEESDLQPPGIPSVPKLDNIGRGRSRGAIRQKLKESQEAQALQKPVTFCPDESDLTGEFLGALSMGHMRDDYMKYVETPITPYRKNKCGKTGEEILLAANYFKCNFAKAFKIYQYHVSFSPVEENVRKRFFLIQSLSHIIGDVKLFDGSTLYLQKLLDKNPVEYATALDSRTVVLKFTCNNEITESNPQFLHIANLIFKKVLVALDMKKIRQHFYNLKQTIQIRQHKIEVIPGYTTSILRYDEGNLLAIDLIHKVIRLDTYLDALYELYENVKKNQEEFRRRATKDLVGVIVLTKYNNKTYRIDDINWDASPSDCFEKNGEKITYKEYYNQVWNIKIRDELQPLLISRPTERDVRRGDRSNLHLVPELCIITGLSNQMRADFVVMRDLAVQTRIDPTERLRQMQKLMDQLLASREVEAMIRPWNISFASEPCHIPARELPPEKLLVKNINNDYIKISYDAREADWSRGLQKASLLNAVNMDRWILICTKENDELAKSLSSSLFKVGRNMNMMINEPLWVKIIDDRNDTYIKAIKTCLKPDTQMVLCVVPNQKKDRYDAIKKCCCIDNPVPSQVVTSRTLSKSKALMSVAAKIAIQMNCKMGGEVWGAEIPLKGLMVVGIDAHHDSALKNKSVGALVASLNKEMTRYFSKTEYHPTKNELMENLQLLLRAALLKYKEVNGALPEKVIIYRDGVGDGQLKKLFHSEYDQAISAFRDAGGDGYRPQSAFIVVKKRILNRFFKPTDSAWTNPKPGTVVDQVVTKPEWYDFFIVSQSVRQGTVSPTSYNVIYDTTHLEPDQMQRLTYKLTHLYFNWQGTIRVPAPCQYAHKLAALQGQSLHKEFSNLLTDKLFYL